MASATLPAIANLSKADEDDLKEKMASSRGVGNFRSMFINIPNSGTRGDPIKFNEVYTQNEVIPACEMFMDAVNCDMDVPKSLQFEFTLANGEK